MRGRGGRGGETRWWREGGEGEVMEGGDLGGGENKRPKRTRENTRVQACRGGLREQGKREREGFRVQGGLREQGKRE